MIRVKNLSVFTCAICGPGYAGGTPPSYRAPPPSNYGAPGGGPSYGAPQSTSYSTPPSGGPGSSYGGTGGYSASPSGVGGGQSPQQDELLSWFQVSLHVTLTVYLLN